MNGTHFVVTWSGSANILPVSLSTPNAFGTRGLDIVVVVLKDAEAGQFMVKATSGPVDFGLTHSSVMLWHCVRTPYD
jgi:hypothetical protein